MPNKNFSIFAIISSGLSYFIYSALFNPSIDYHVVAIVLLALFFFLEKKGGVSPSFLVTEGSFLLIFTAASLPLLFLILSSLLPFLQNDWLLYVFSIHGGLYLSDLVEK